MNPLIIRSSGEESTPKAPASSEFPTQTNATEEKPLTCSLQEAASITGLSYDYVLGQSKVANPEDRIPGFKTGKSTYRVIISKLPHWLDQKAGLSQ